MKYALILPDGAADEPLDELDGRTPLEVARTPHMDRIAQQGQVGSAVTVPAGFLPGSDVATLSVVGYDPQQHYTGRALLEAAAQKIPVGPNDVVFRCNLCTILDQVMIDFSAGHITQEEAVSLIGDLNQTLGNKWLTFYPGVMYRHLMVLKDGAGFDARCTPPHDIPDQPIGDHLPQGPDADVLVDLQRRAQALLADHPVNNRRRSEGQAPATSIWLWGQGPMPRLPIFQEQFGVRGACIAAVDLIRGIALLAGWQLIDVEGATGYLDTNYQGKGQAAVEALDDFDLVVVHVEAPDEAGHKGDAAEKILAIERVDEHVVGPIMERLPSFGDWRVLIAPDHPTPVATRTHTSEPPPFCIAGSGVEHRPPDVFSEMAAASSNLRMDPGFRMMAFFLSS